MEMIEGREGEEKKRKREEGKREEEMRRIKEREDREKVKQLKREEKSGRKKKETSCAHANNLFESGTPYNSACCLVCKWRRDGSAITSKASSNLLNDDTYQCVCVGNYVIHPDK